MRDILGGRDKKQGEHKCGRERQGRVSVREKRGVNKQEKEKEGA